MDFRCDQTLGPERVYGHFLSMIPIGGFALVPNLAKNGFSSHMYPYISIRAYCRARILIY